MRDKLYLMCSLAETESLLDSLESHLIFKRYLCKMSRNYILDLFIAAQCKFYHQTTSIQVVKAFTGYCTCVNQRDYDTVSDVVESGVHWGSNFQIGSRVLKNCYKPILMHIYVIQCDFMHRSC